MAKWDKIQWDKILDKADFAAPSWCFLTGKLCLRGPKETPRQPYTTKAKFSLIRMLVSNWHTESQKPLGQKCRTIGVGGRGIEVYN